MRLLTNLLFEPKGMHNQNAAYNIKDTVMSGDGSRVYFAIQDVPAGIPLNDSNYWKLQIDLSASKSAMDQALASFGNYAKEIGTRVKGETAKASGNPVTFLPDAGSLLQPVTVLEPQQQGSGEPSPSNIRPIIGYDKLKLNHVGKNLCNISPFLSAWSTENADMLSLINTLTPGTYTVSVVFEMQNPERASATSKYGFYFYPYGDRVLVEWGSVAVGTTRRATYTFNVTADNAGKFTAAYFYGCGEDGIGYTGYATTKDVQLEINTTATPYEPYHGKLHTVQIGQTVYGGRFDWLTGKGVIEWALATLTGDETDWALSAAGNFYSYNVVRNLGSDEGYCSHYKTTNDLGSTDAAIAFYAGDTAAIRDSRFMSVADWKAFLTAQNAAGTPVQIAYKLASPIEIQLDAHVISAADPEQTNTLYGDGHIEVEYVKPLHASIGGGSAPVQSVNGKTGNVQLTAMDVGAASKDDFDKLSEEKIDKQQGADNALKLLFVADDGNVSTVSAESGVEVQMKGDETDESIIVNLWKPDNYELGSFSNAGNKYAGDGTAMRSAEWIEVTPGAEYSAYFIKQPQLGMSLFFYDADGNFLEKKWAGGTLCHFTATGIKYVNFVVSSWYAKHPDDGVLPQMMLWRTTSTDLPTEYVEYGRYDKPRLLAPGVARNAADILAVRRAAFDGQFLNIAYSTIHKGIINSTEHFMTASKLGFNTLKCDVQPTSDGELVLCHDAGYTFDDNGRILQTMDESNNTAIITMTAAEVAALEFAGAQDAQDYYSHPCFLEDFVRICKERGKVAFITIRDDHIPDVVAPKLLEIVQKYSMVSRTIVNSFNIESLKAVRNLNKEICLHQIGTRNQVLTTARVDQINDLGNAMFGLYMHPAGTGSTVLADSAAAIEYAHRKGVRVLGAASSTYAEYNECIVNGLAGTQINSAILPYKRELLTFSVAVSGGVAAFTNTGTAERYTGEAVLSADEITVRNIKLQGSTRDFPDGILPIWMKYLPHRMEIVSTSGQTCNVTYSNHAWHITATNIAADDTYKVYIEI